MNLLQTFCHPRSTNVLADRSGLELSATVVVGAAIVVGRGITIETFPSLPNSDVMVNGTNIACFRQIYHIFSPWESFHPITMLRISLELLPGQQNYPHDEQRSIILDKKDKST